MGIIPEWAIGGAVLIFAVAVAQIVVVKLRASVRRLPASDEEIGELREAFAAMQNRMGEMEERLDFTERLLAQYREADRLGPPPAQAQSVRRQQRRNVGAGTCRRQSQQLSANTLRLLPRERKSGCAISGQF